MVEEELIWAFIQSSVQHVMSICSTRGTRLVFGSKSMNNRGRLVWLCAKALELDLKNSRFGLLVLSLEHGTESLLPVICKMRIVPRSESCFENQVRKALGVSGIWHMAMHSVHVICQDQVSVLQDSHLWGIWVSN